MKKFFAILIAKSKLLSILASLIIAALLVYFTVNKNEEKAENVLGKQQILEQSPSPSLKLEPSPTKQKTKQTIEIFPSPIVTPSPLPTPTPFIIEQPPSLEISSPVPDFIILESLPQPDPTTNNDQERALLELELNRLTSLYEETKLRYELALEDITRSIIKAKSAEFTRRGLPLSSGMFQKDVDEAIEPYVNRNQLDKEAALREIQYQIDLIRLSLGY